MPTGEEFFDSLRTNGLYYIDKTEMIYDLLNDESAKVTLFTRPRRFGKTLTMTMMKSFFDITQDNRRLFEGLSILKHTDFCDKWMNKYPVLFLSFKDISGLDYEGAYGMLKSCISQLCINNSFLLSSKKVDQSDINIFKRLKSMNASTDEINYSLLTLSRMLNDHFGQPVVLLIDEYDVPLSRAHDEDKSELDYYPKMLNTIRSIMSSALKTNPFLKTAVITGCLRIAKESIFTGVNNFKTYGIIDKRFSDAFGFTDSEVTKLLSDTGYEDKLPVIKQWYDGYIFGNSEIYCPWDVLNYISDLSFDSEHEPESYWKNTSSNDIIDDFLDEEGFDVSEKFETLMNGGTIEQTIGDRLTYGNLREKEDNLWSILFMTGYLTKSDIDEKGSAVRLKIPNTEIFTIFRDSVISHVNTKIEPDIRKEVMDALWSGDEKKVSKLITDLLFDTISYFDYHEDYYHAFITGLIASSKGCSVKSNQESGLGRTDIIVTDRKNRRAIIIEAKKAASAKSLEKEALDGKQQIIDKQYIKGLSGFSKITCYGIAFFEKTALAKILDV